MTTEAADRPLGPTGLAAEAYGKARALTVLRALLAMGADEFMREEMMALELSRAFAAGSVFGLDVAREAIKGAQAKGNAT